LKKALALLLLSFSLVLVSASSALACPKTHGKSPQDKAVADKLCKQEPFTTLKDWIILTSVQESILYLDITPDMYRGFRQDHLTAKGVIGNLSRVFQKTYSGSGRLKTVTVWFYVNKEKMITADRSGGGGETKVKFN